MGDPQEDRPCSQSIESFLFNNFFSVLEIIPIEYMSMILFFFITIIILIAFSCRLFGLLVEPFWLSA